MPLIISDEWLERMGLTEREARIEFACRLFDADRISLPTASKLAGLSRVELEEELFNRKIPAYRPTVEDLEQDMKAFEKLDAERRQQQRDEPER